MCGVGRKGVFDSPDPLKAIGSTSGGTGTGESAVVANNGARLSSSSDIAIEVGRLVERLAPPERAMGIPVAAPAGRGGVTIIGDAAAD